MPPLTATAAFAVVSRAPCTQKNESLLGEQPKVHPYAPCMAHLPTSGLDL